MIKMILNTIWELLGALSNILIALIILFLLFMFIKNRYLLSIAFRNVFRNKRRSVITITAIAIGVIAIIIFGGFIEDTYYGLRESTIRSQIGHLQIYQKGYKEFGTVKPLCYKLYEFKKIMEIIKNDEILKNKIEVLSPEVEISGLASTGDSSSTFVAKGVDPEADRILSSFDGIKNGNKLKNEDAGKITLGHILAKTLGVTTNDPVMLLIQTPAAGLNVIDTEVKGITESFSSDYDKVSVKMPIKDAWYLLGTEYVDKIIILLYKTKDLDLVLTRIKDLAKINNYDLEYSTWQDLALFYKGVVSLYNGFFNFVKWIIVLIIIVFIANTLYMTVMERVNEIGTLRTIGTSKFKIIKNFITESLIMGIIGGLLGITAAFLLSRIINILGIPMPPPPGASTGYTANVRLDAESLKFIFFSLKLSLITALFASFPPAKKAAGMNIVDSLRYY